MRLATSPVQPVWCDGAEPGAVVAVEVLVEQQVVVPGRVVLQPLDLPKHGPAAAVVGHEEGDQPAAQVLGDVGQSHLLPEPVGHSTM